MDSLVLCAISIAFHHLLNIAILINMEDKQVYSRIIVVPSGPILHCHLCTVYDCALFFRFGVQLLSVQYSILISILASYSCSCWAFRILPISTS